MLGTYADWHDMTLWPALPGQTRFTKLAVKQGDPESKNGVVGAFCRAYDIQRAMDELIPGIYELVDNDEINGYRRWCSVLHRKLINKPPQSWCYCEGTED